jgi:hypothetical protein
MALLDLQSLEAELSSADKGAHASEKGGGGGGSRLSLLLC